MAEMAVFNCAKLCVEVGHSRQPETCGKVSVSKYMLATARGSLSSGCHPRCPNNFHGFPQKYYAKLCWNHQSTHTVSTREVCNCYRFKGHVSCHQLWMDNLCRPASTLWLFERMRYVLKIYSIPCEPCCHLIPIQ